MADTPRKTQSPQQAESLEQRQQRWARAAAWNTSQHLNEMETTMWRSERHPQQSSTISALLVLDRAPDWDRLVAAHSWAAELVPRIRQRVVEPLLPTGPPAWADDPGFDLSYHLRRRTLGPRTDLAGVLDTAQSLVLTPFDRGRPLWEATLLEGLDGGRAAFVLKVHHSLADGLAMVQLLSSLHSRTRRHTAKKPIAAANRTPTAPVQDPWQVTVDGVTDLVGSAPSLARGAISAVARAAADPVETLTQSQRYLASLRRILAAGEIGTPSPLLRHRTGRAWILRTLDCSLAELRNAGRAAGGSVNDAYLAALLGGLRRYHEHHGTPVGDLPVTMPVSLRRADDPLGGNKFAGAVFGAPAGIEDPAERIAVIRGLVLSVVTEPALDTFSVLAPVVNRLPAVVGATIMKNGGARTDLAASNVPGIREEVFLAGARIDRYVPFGPLPGVAVMAVMTSYAGTCSIGLTIDGTAVADVDVLEQCFRAGLEEVLDLARPAKRRGSSPSTTARGGRP